ncbi:MAG: hypothetical protein HQL95_02395 [Magnetococcales bacterium]|nr:hypothetical protein [Magnetococcales bacterium]
MFKNRLQLSGILILFVFALYGNRSYETLLLPDSHGYLMYTMQMTDFHGLLSSIRTIGYPLFLNLIHKVFNDFSVIATVQLVIHELSITALFFGLLRFGFHAWGALFAVLPLFFFNSFFSCMLTDSLVMSTGLFTLAQIFYMHGKVEKPTVPEWIVLSILLALSYHMHPRNLSYLIIAPLAGLLLYYSKNVILHGRMRWNQFRSVVISYALVVTVPFFCYCLFRFVVVGHFGLVSFGGINIIGVTVPMMQQATLSRLSQDVQPLAKKILDETGRLNLQKFDPPTRDHFILGYRFYKPLEMTRHYNTHIHVVSVPAVVELQGVDNVRNNKLLLKLATETILLYPVEYVRWVLSGLINAVNYNKVYIENVNLVLLFVFLIFFRWVAGIASCEKKGKSYLMLDHQFSVLSAVAIMVFFLMSLLVVLVEPPLVRYMEVATVLVPSLISFLLWKIACQSWLLLTGKD